MEGMDFFEQEKLISKRIQEAYLKVEPEFIKDLDQECSGVVDKRMESTETSFGNLFLKYYFSRVSEKHLSIELKSNIMSGMPVVKGTRVNITTILGYLKDGEEFSAIEEDFKITKNEFEDVLSYTINILSEPYE